MSFFTGNYCSLTPPIHTSPISSCTDSTKCFYNPPVGITGENLAGRLGPELSESPIKEDTSSFITDSPSKLIDGSKSSFNSRASIEIDAKKSLSLSSVSSRQASTSGANP
ncbi:hypothetical protein AYI68_g3807 [Smittium mucronatum]|uniref:Uncharacterized protein n=1 Tax=Smittium mucronatum TaxID=133383 RepID=A0A1R0GYW8_9FUNG|nr:hypothetical protein AYI68_g3807 [Smittium mucronatum]